MTPPLSDPQQTLIKAPGVRRPDGSIVYVEATLEPGSDTLSDVPVASESEDGVDEGEATVHAPILSQLICTPVPPATQLRTTLTGHGGLIAGRTTVETPVSAHPALIQNVRGTIARLEREQAALEATTSRVRT